MLKQRIQEDMKSALKGGDKPRLGIVRLILAAIKQREVDERRELGDEEILAVLDKMVKQRRDSIAQYEQARRQDLSDQEKYEMEVCQTYLPEALAEEKIARLIEAAIASTGASSMRDMGKVMGQLKPKVQGRADMGAVSALVKQKLSG
jgi:hypothetical protein